MPPTTFLDNLRSFATAGKNYILNGGTLVDQNTANIRAQICSGCHNNVPSGESRQNPGGCSACGKMAQAGIDSVRAIVLGSRHSSSDSLLKSCLLCGCDLKLKVWFPVKYFDPDCSQGNKYPTFCWIKDCK